MFRTESITSPANPLLKDIRRAIQRGGLTEEGLCVAETFHLLEEALRSDCEVTVVLAGESVRSVAVSHVKRLHGVRVLALPDALMQKLSGAETSQGVIALVRPPVWTMEQVFRGCPLVIVLDGVQDPGNAGAIIRAAEAFGATGALFLKGSVSPFNTKTLRASAGSLFRVPHLYGIDPELARAALQGNRVPVYAGVPAGRPGSKPVTAVNLKARCGLIVGNEARGVSSELLAAAVSISIPTAGVESLNAAMAAGILLYEARRQRLSAS